MDWLPTSKVVGVGDVVDLGGGGHDDDDDDDYDDFFTGRIETMEMLFSNKNTDDNNRPIDWRPTSRVVGVGDDEANVDDDDDDGFINGGSPVVMKRKRGWEGGGGVSTTTTGNTMRRTSSTSLSSSILGLGGLDNNYDCVSFCSGWNNNKKQQQQQQQRQSHYHYQRGHAPQYRRQQQLSDRNDTNLDTQLAQELQNLSVNERNTLYEEWNGIVNVIEEDPLFVESKLRQLDNELNKYNDNDATVIPCDDNNDYNNGSSSNVVHHPPRPDPSKNTNPNDPTIFNTYAYQLALSIDSTFIHNKKFKLMFLRGFKFDVIKTTRHVIIHFTWKLYLFGEQLLTRNITLNDLNEDDLYSLHQQQFLFLPGTDRAGRKVAMAQMELYSNSNDNKPKFRSWYNHCRSIYYQNMIVAQDEANQKLGIVVIGYFVDNHLPVVSSTTVDTTTGNYNNNNASSTRQQFGLDQNYLQFPKFGECLPIHKAAFHLHIVKNKRSGSSTTATTTIASALISILHKLATKEEKARFKIHYGSHTECHYELLSVGINSSCLSIDSEGQNRDGMGQQYINHRRIVEQQIQQVDHQKPKITGPNEASSMSMSMSMLSSDSSFDVDDDQIIVQPNDIVLGRGHKFQYHPGNLQLGRLIEQHFDEFQQMGKDDKTNLTRSIVKTIQDDYDGRFLEQMVEDGDKKKTTVVDLQSCKWKIVTNDIARKKVAYGFRTLKKMRKKKTKDKLETTKNFQTKGAIAC